MPKQVYTTPDKQFVDFVKDRIQSKSKIYYAFKNHGLVLYGIPKKIGKSVTGYTIILDDGTKIPDQWILGIDQQLTENTMKKLPRKLKEQKVLNGLKRMIREQKLNEIDYNSLDDIEGAYMNFLKQSLGDTDERIVRSIKNKYWTKIKNLIIQSTSGQGIQKPNY